MTLALSTSQLIKYTMPLQLGLGFYAYNKMAEKELLGDPAVVFSPNGQISVLTASIAIAAMATFRKSYNPVQLGALSLVTMLTLAGTVDSCENKRPHASLALNGILFPAIAIAQRSFKPLGAGLFVTAPSLFLALYEKSILEPTEKI